MPSGTHHISTETAHVDETQFLALFVPEACTGVFAGITCSSPLELAGHAQVHAPDTTGSIGVRMMERGHQIFAATRPFADGLAT